MTRCSSFYKRANKVIKPFLEPFYKKLVKPVVNWLKKEYDTLKNDLGNYFKNGVARMIKKIIEVIAIVALVIFFVNDNLKGNSVYYARHSSSINHRELALAMLAENVNYMPEVTGFKYKYKSTTLHSIRNESRDTYFSSDFDDGQYEYAYTDEVEKSYYFNQFFELQDIIDFGDDMKHLDVTTVDEGKIKDKIYEDFKLVLQELENNKPLINLQGVFNWVYRDRIN